MTRRILFVTGTRADFGKLKSLIQAIHDDENFEYGIFVTGMHLLSKYGSTIDEIVKCKFTNIYPFINQSHSESMEQILANTIAGLSRFLMENHFDLIVIHGDRIETLAAAIVGGLQDRLVAHIEGGEISGSVDEHIRHAVTKLSHFHFVSNEEARRRIVQLGEREENIIIIGSPDIDIMLSNNLPSLSVTKERYGIKFDDYSIVLFHSVTTEFANIYKHAQEMVQALLNDTDNYIVIFPNNDKGCDFILEAYEKFKDHHRFKIFPSVRFEYFLTLLKHSRCIIGNSSAGIREAPLYGVPSINIGTRQNGRYFGESIINVDYQTHSIQSALARIKGLERFVADQNFGSGQCAAKFHEYLKSDNFWEMSKQKMFVTRN